MAKVVRLAVLVAVAALAPRAEADVLAEYLNDKTFGPIPGPCPGPTKYDEVCAGDVSDIRQSTNDSEDCIAEGEEETCGTIGSYVTEGEFTIWDLQCKDLQIADVQVTHVVMNGDKLLRANVDVRNFKMSCTGMVRVEDLTMEIEDVIKAKCTFEGPFTMIQTPQFDGVSLRLEINFETESVTTLNADLPAQVRIPYDQCDIEPELNLQLSGIDGFESTEVCIFYGWGSWLSDDFGCSTSFTSFINYLGADNILELVATTAEGYLGGVLCQMIEDAAYVEDTGENGPLNDVWAEIKAQVDEWGLAKGLNVATADTNSYLLSTSQYSGITSQELNDAIDFTTSEVIDPVSDALNGWLSPASSRAEYEGRPVVNEVIDAFTDPAGELAINLADYDAEMEVQIPLNVSDVTMILRSAKIQGLNSISVIELLDIGEDLPEASRPKRTSNNTIVVDELVLEVESFMRLDRGSWVTASCNLPPPGTCSSDSAEYTFRYSVLVQDVSLKLSLLSLINPDEILDLQVGQILGIDFSEEPFGAFSKALRCIAPAVYALNFTNIEASIGSISDPQLIGNDGSEFASLVQSSVALATDVAKGALRTKFPGIANGPIREYFNEVLLTEVSIPGRAGTQSCPAWEGPSGDGPTVIDFDGEMFSPVYELVNEGIGGEPIRESDIGLNHLIDEALKYNEESYVSFPFSSEGRADGEWRLKDEYDKSGLLQSLKYNQTGDFLQFYDGTIGNLNTLYKLIFSSPSEGLDIDFGFGGALQLADDSGLADLRPLELTVYFQAVVPSRDIDEAVEIKLSLTELDFAVELTRLAIDFDLIYALYFSQIDRIPCLLAALDEISFRREARQVSISNLEFEVNSVRTGADRSSNLVQALDNLDAEQPGQSSMALITTLFDAAVDRILDTVERIPGIYGDLTAETCVNMDDSLDNLTNGVLKLDLPNVTQSIEECTAEIGEVPSVEEVESEVYNGNELPDLLNVRESFLVRVIRQGVEVLKGSTLDQLFAELVQLSDLGIDQFFVLDDPDDPSNTNVTFVFPLSILDLGLDLTSEDPGFKFNAGTVRIKSVNRLLDSFYLFEPVGSMTTRHRFTFRDDEPLEITIESSIEIEGSAVGAEAGTTVTEDLVLAMQISNLTIVGDLVTAINREKMLDLTLSQLFSVDAEQALSMAPHAADCLLSTLYENGLALRNIDVSLSELSGVVLTSSRELLSAGVEETASALIELVAYFYADALPRIAQNCVVPYANAVFKEYIETASCPLPEDIAPPNMESGDPLIRFDSLDLLDAFLSLWFSDAVAGGYTNVNDVLYEATKDLVFLDENALGGDESFNVSIPLVYNGIFYGEILFGLANIEITGINTIEDLRPFIPFKPDGNPMYDPQDYLPESRRRLAELTTSQQPYTTQTNIAMSGPVTISCKVTFNTYDLFVGYPEMINELDIAVTVTDLDFGLQLLFAVDWADFLNVQLRAWTTLKQLPCLLVPVRQLQPLDFNFTTSDIDITVSCAGRCEFPFIEYLEEGDELSTSDSAEISQAVNELVEYVDGFLTTRGAQELINSTLALAAEECAALSSTEETLENDDSLSEADAASTFAYIFLGGCGVAGIGMLLLVPLHRSRQQSAIKSKIAGTKPHERGEDFVNEIALTELRAKSIFQHPITPSVARFLVPFIAIMNVVGLVVAIAFSEAANIVVSITIFGATSESVALVPFTLFSTINDTWNSGAWAMAIFIAVASCMWPITKNLLLLFLWFVPTTIVGTSRRQRAIEILDMLGKWSFLDVFVIVITLAALRAYVVGAFYGNMTFLDESFFVTDVSVTPEDGLVLLAFVASLSLIINHVVMYYHERVVESNRRSEDHALGNHDVARMMPRLAALKLPIMKHQFTGINEEGQSRVVSPIAARVLLGVSSVSFLCICVGIATPLITFELRGLLGLLLEIISSDDESTSEDFLNRKTYSAVQMGALLSTSPTTTGLEAVIIAFFKTLFAATVFAAPLVLLGMQAVLFVMPINLNMGRSFFFWTKICSYWSGLEIFLVGLVLTVMEISVATQFITDFVTDDACSQIRGSLELLVDSDLDAYCFNAVGYFEPTAFFLFTGIILELVSFYIISVIAHAVLADRYFDAYNAFRSDAKPHKMLRINRWLLFMCTRLQDPLVPGTPGTPSMSPSGPDSVSGRSAGPFTDLDQDDDDLIAPDEPWCRLLSGCCSNEKGQRSADARIDVWHAKFNTRAPGGGGRVGVRRESDNPAFAGTSPTAAQPQLRYPGASNRGWGNQSRGAQPLPRPRGRKDSVEV
ncbi:Hypothetical Protein FCC1311_102212 [Hondaea fermentalgiana]|uniref:Uncharacterized protein n=1 Tax=Hondaea fermentalgiana TaxID=2315210 RepID=A0A2R5GW52_9STRA|nr:Hypothetical Protein FCC1311_102212 [Hondaea fermentalgiana]|eukprot:GBG33998.1 Hypothetical Protein FCC1311_102212 [Hondaea fermentalgiana]